METNNIIKLYKNLVLNLNLMTDYDYTMDEKKNGESGSPDASYSSIALLYAIIKKNDELLELKINENNLFSYLITYARMYLNSDYNNYIQDHKLNITLDDYILKIWINIEKNHMEYYYSNGAYDLYGIAGIQLRKLLIMSMKNI